MDNKIMKNKIDIDSYNYSDIIEILIDKLSYGEYSLRKLTKNKLPYMSNFFMTLSRSLNTLKIDQLSDIFNVLSGEISKYIIEIENKK